ncbi:hypothetical protein [Sphingomonas sp. TZW2008]|uniref:hypothetical protein n=1 Tax=Sphingomonas sp. TZW2008 TaxID=1917973 RepID=UPI000A272247|nr:hypothetical protein [Sphingomonas sp. TZW2008]
MLADSIVTVAADGFTRGRRVHLETTTLAGAPISEIEHLGGGLLRYRHPGQPSDHYVPERAILRLSVMPPEDEL